MKSCNILIINKMKDKLDFILKVIYIYIYSSCITQIKVLLYNNYAIDNNATWMYLNLVEKN